MRKIVTVACSFAFLLSGILLSTMHPVSDGYKDINAAPLPTINYINPNQLPLDLQLDLANKQQKTEKDTVYITKKDTVTVVKKKYIRVTKKEIVRDTVSNNAIKDTLYVSKPCVIIPVVKEEATDSIINTVDSVKNI